MMAKLSLDSLALKYTVSVAEAPPDGRAKTQVVPLVRFCSTGPVSSSFNDLLATSRGTTSQPGATPVAAGVPSLGLLSPPPPQAAPVRPTTASTTSGATRFRMGTLGV